MEKAEIKGKKSAVDIYNNPSNRNRFERSFREDQAMYKQ